MARPRQLALVLLCGTVTIAGWGAARLGGFEWSGIENIATPIWNRGPARGAATPPPLLARNGSGRCDHVPSQAARACRRARPATDAAMVDPAPRETAFVRGGVTAAEVPVVEAALPDARPTPPAETSARLVSLFRPDARGGVRSTGRAPG